VVDFGDIAVRYDSVEPDILSGNEGDARAFKQAIIDDRPMNAVAVNEPSRPRV